jgi:hypothetical protein
MNQTGLTLEQQATNADTSKHIRTVGKVIHLFVKQLLDRIDQHDQSKLASPEVKLFTEYTPKLARSTYGSEEYEGFRKAMGPALDHHYAKNDHHPEHFKPPEGDPELQPDIEWLACAVDIPPSMRDRLIDRLERAAKTEVSTINEMNLLQLVEMFCDWKAATLRHNNGNLRKSIEHNAVRFGMAEQLERIFENTAVLVDGITQG